jgi:hypothetical protein
MEAMEEQLVRRSYLNHSSGNNRAIRLAKAQTDIFPIRI